ncbi:MAG: diacylglycerol/lipid kinase family protein [Acidimicrobiia bacterium]
MSEIRNPRGRNATVLALVAGFIAGLVAAALFWRKQVPALLGRQASYDRRPSTATRPALIINRWSGDGKAEHYGLEKAAKALGVRTIMLEQGMDLAQIAHDAVSTGADAIGMAGGDGSLGLVAGVAIERGVPFFCVPVGTRNHFALDLGLDRDNPLSALEALEDGEEILIDYGVAATRPFLNNVSFGVYAQAVHRDEYRENTEETMAAVLSEAAANVENQAVIRYATPNGQRHDHAPLLLISNNPYQMTGPPDYGRRLRLDAGRLGVGAVTNLPEDSDLGSLTLEQLRTLQSWETRSIRLESDEPILAGLDGEALEFDSPLDISVRPKGLRVLVPRSTEPGYVPPGEVVAAKLVDMARAGGA